MKWAIAQIILFTFIKFESTPVNDKKSLVVQRTEDLAANEIQSDTNVTKKFNCNYHNIKKNNGMVTIFAGTGSSLASQMRFILAFAGTGIYIYHIRSKINSNVSKL